MGILVTTIEPQIAFKGQSFRVYLNQSEAAVQLPLISINDTVDFYTSSTEIYGYVSSIDLFGNSFLVTPLICYNITNTNPTLTPGYIPSGTDIEVNI